MRPDVLPRPSHERHPVEAATSEVGKVGPQDRKRVVLVATGGSASSFAAIV
jgi:hypothetical protein